MKPTKDELQAVLQANLLIRKNLPEFSTFGDANWDKIDEQNKVIQAAIDGETIRPDFEEEDSDLYACQDWCANGDKSSDYGKSVIEDAEHYREK